MRLSKETLDILREFDSGAEKAAQKWETLSRTATRFECHSDIYNGLGIWIAGYWFPFTYKSNQRGS